MQNDGLPQFWVCVHGQSPRCFRAHHAHQTDGELVLVNRWPGRRAGTIVAHFPLEMVAYWWEGQPQPVPSDSIVGVVSIPRDTPDASKRTTA
jgi:hypothetical protein